ncbi:hypothetical protein ebA4600 [Aromatoleum aromaticum EbN1]|uniref:Uncharacterized protein n=1 Tax=Aromatoleum aromaticum (strain DSM 19018 / LMG 30748 / EbN1) TaxID=76114 RepID=Q5P1T4_AROAE|nr:hypothetical protein ebA4600 [Aromatoleum aromaticum EbN1]
MRHEQAIHERRHRQSEFDPMAVSPLIAKRTRARADTELLTPNASVLLLRKACRLRNHLAVISSFVIIKPSLRSGFVQLVDGPYALQRGTQG